ncbi:MAG: hypothetical protein IPO00_13945 [Betaproteobacteria bacterium]|nr:hypothetical protein [Betaproteobacteria bacterium]
MNENAEAVASIRKDGAQRSTVEWNSASVDINPHGNGQYVVAAVQMVAEGRILRAAHCWRRGWEGRRFSGRVRSISAVAPHPVGAVVNGCIDPPAMASCIAWANAGPEITGIRVNTSKDLPGMARCISHACRRFLDGNAGRVAVTGTRRCRHGAVGGLFASLHFGLTVERDQGNPHFLYGKRLHARRGCGAGVRLSACPS